MAYLIWQRLNNPSVPSCLITFAQCILALASSQASLSANSNSRQLFLAQHPYLLAYFEFSLSFVVEPRGTCEFGWSVKFIKSSFSVTWLDYVMISHKSSFHICSVASS